MNPTIEEFRSVFSYCPESGIVFKNGRIVANLRGVSFWYRGHKRHMGYARAAFFLHFGYLPRCVKLRNGDYTDTRAQNLYDPVAPENALEWVESQKGTAQ